MGEITSDLHFPPANNDEEIAPPDVTWEMIRMGIHLFRDLPPTPHSIQNKLNRDQISNPFPVFVEEVHLAPTLDSNVMLLRDQQRR